MSKRWIWKTYLPVRTLKGMPDKATLLEQQPIKVGSLVVGYEYVPTGVFDPKNKKHFIKTPPYVRMQLKLDRSTRAKRRAIKDARRLEKLSGSEARAA